MAPAQGAQIYQKVPYWHFWHLAPYNLRFFEKVPYGTSKSENVGKSAQMALLAFLQQILMALQNPEMLRKVPNTTLSHNYKISLV